MTKLLLYVCAPYRGKDEAEIKKNIDFALDCARWVLRKNRIPFVPHINTERLFGLVANDADVVPYDDEMVKRCDAILVCGAKITAGMKHEMELATLNEKAIIFLESPYEDNQSKSQS